MAESNKSGVIWHGDELLKAIGDNLDDALFEGAKVIQEAAIAKAPVDTGELKRSIYAASATKHNYKKTGKRDRRIKPTKGTAVIGAAVWYGRLVEYGTAKAAAQPFLRPAFDENKDKALRVAADYLAKKLDTE